MLFTALALQAGVAADDIVITARRRCDVEIAGRIIRAPEFRARAADWAAGRPVRVTVTRTAETKCLLAIVRQLHAHGVTRITFVEPKDEVDR